MTGRERLLRAWACEPVDKTPVWLMRQAGRVLPEYRALKQRHSFVEMVRTPELATEVTLQPIRRFGFDAAIIFSDILVIPEALGQAYQFADEGGIQMAFAIRKRGDIERLAPGRIRDRLEYVGDALRLVRRELGETAALIGFSGSPWTLANFMIEGGSSSAFGRALDLFQTDRATYDFLAERLTTAIIDYLHLQCDAGAEAVQIFDTLAHLLPPSAFAQASGEWIRRIVDAVGRRVPVIVFCKGAQAETPILLETRAKVLGVDSSIDLGRLRVEIPPTIGIQGNLDPHVLVATPEVVRARTRSILEVMRDRPGHVFNLGHGVPPLASLENIETLVSTVRSFS